MINIGRLFIIGVVALLVSTHSANAQKNCRKGIPCGRTCIAANKVCRIESGPPARAEAPAPARAAVEPWRFSVGTSGAWVGSARQTYYRALCGARDHFRRRTRVYSV